MADQEVKNRKEYFRHYYEERKSELLQERHDRYHSDPEYRERAKAHARAYRQKKKAERDRLRASGELPPAPPRGPRKPDTVMIGGETHRAHTVRIAATELNRSVGTINYWTNVGLLPVTPLRSKRGERLYTDAMILVMKMAISRRGKVALRDDSFREEIETGWKEIGVFPI